MRNASKSPGFAGSNSGALQSIAGRDPASFAHAAPSGWQGWPPQKPAVQSFLQHASFEAHEKGDANRSARVERPFHFIEHNFLAGRTFADLPDLNVQARAFCDKVNAMPKRHLHASPRELFVAERPHLRPLPLFVPEVYAIHHRLVDGTMLHVSTWSHAAGATIPATTVRAPQAAGWIQLYAVGPGSL